jgi:hypothetical protein
LIPPRELNEVGVRRLEAGGAELSRDLSAVIAAVHCDVCHNVGYAAPKISSGAIAVSDATRQLPGAGAADEPLIEIGVLRGQVRALRRRHVLRPNGVRRRPSLDAREPQVFDGRDVSE